MTEEKTMDTVKEVAVPFAGEGASVIAENPNENVIATNAEAKVDSIMETLDPNGVLHKEIRYIFLLSEAKKVGIKLCILKGNRKVYINQVEKLWKDLKDATEKVFDNPCLCVSAKDILKNHPTYQIEDLYGNSITLDNPDIDKSLVIYDGQHRATACLLHPELDVKIELKEYEGDPVSQIKKLNSFDKNWTNDDLKNSNLATGKTTNKLYNEAQKLVEAYKVSSKYAEYILTFKKDATRKADLVKGTDTTIWSDANGARGIGIIDTTMKVFGTSQNEVKKIQYLDAIVEVYNSCGDTHHPTFSRDIKCFINTFGTQEKTNILQNLKDGNYGQLKCVLVKLYEDFLKNHTNEELTVMEAEVDTEVAEFKAKNAGNNTSAGITALKVGTPAELLKNRQNLADLKKQLAEQKKAEKKVEKEAIKAQAQANTEAEKKEDND